MARQPSSDATSDEQLELFDAVLTDVSVKVDMHSLEHPLFTLSSKPSKQIRHYRLGQDCEITIVPSADGAPTLHDKDILVYLTSQLKAALNAGLKVSPLVNINGYDLLSTIGRQSGGSDYKRLRAALTRLRGTTIRTRIRTGGRQTESGFGLIDSWTLIEQPSVQAPRLQVRLGDWLYRAILAGEVLVVDERYFQLQGLERRIYEVLRKHLGDQTTFRIRLDTLREKCAAATQPRRFKFEVKRILDRAEETRVAGKRDPFCDWLLMLNGEVLCGYANSDGGRNTRAEDARKHLRSSMPVTAPAKAAFAEAST
jgi:plasmid replication initiation protein